MKFYIKEKESLQDKLMREQNELLKQLLLEQAAMRKELAALKNQTPIVQSGAPSSNGSVVEEKIEFDFGDEEVFIPTSTVKADVNLSKVKTTSSELEAGAVEKLRKAKNK